MPNDWEGFPKNQVIPSSSDIMMRKNSDGVYVMPPRLEGMTRVKITMTEEYHIMWFDEKES